MGKWRWQLGALLLGLLTACSQPQPVPPTDPQPLARGQLLGSGGLKGPSELHSQALRVGDVPIPSRVAPPTPSPVPARASRRSSAPLPPSQPEGVRYPSSRPRPAADQQGQQSEPAPLSVGTDQVQTEELPLMSAVPELGGDLSSSGRGSEISYLLLEISPSNEAAVPPARLFLGLVVDVSGSMGDDGVQLAAEACAELFGALKPLDQGFLVAFASEARRLTLPSLNYIGIRQALQSADVGGGTQLGQGVRVARDSMPAGSPGTMRHLILVTDGYTNDEALCKKVCSEAWSQGISVSSVGIGNCSAQLLKSIAERCSGSYYHVASLKDLANVVVADRRKVESVVLRNLEVEARFAPGVQVRRAFRVGSLAEVQPRQGRFALGNLHSGKPLQLLFELEVKGATGSTQKIAEVDLHSRNPDGTARAPQPIQQIWANRAGKKGPMNPHVMSLVDKVYAQLSRRR